MTSSAAEKANPSHARNAATDKAPAGKQASRTQKRAKGIAARRYLRYGVQLAFFILAPALFSGAFNGVKYLFAQIGAGQALEPTAFVVQFVMVAAFTVAFGRFFCGYACAFGTLGDYLYNGFEFLRQRTTIPRPEFPPALVKALSLVKYIVLAFICAACFMGAWQSFSGSSPWVAFAAILSGSFEGLGLAALVLLVLVMVGMILRERFFCQFLCPLGAVFTLLPVMGFSQFTRTKAHCAKKCGRCHQACPVDIWPDSDSIDQGECISCGRCADACPLSNVNFVAIERKLGNQLPSKPGQDAKSEAGPTAVDSPDSAKVQKAVAESGEATEQELRTAAHNKARGKSRPLRKTPDKWLLLRGTEPGVIVAKALALMFLCWIVGAMRYVPPFVEVFGVNPLAFFS